jgi:3-(3-hydroxy-phenyl)propionate hydroxylase
VLSLSLAHEFVRPLYHWRTSRPHEYTHSMLNATGDDDALFTAGPARGAPPRNIRLRADDFLLDHLGGGFDLLYFTTGDTIPAPLRAVVDEVRARGVVVRIGAVGTALAEGADQCFADADGHFRARYGVGCTGAAYLLRPDQHVCGRWVTLDATRLHAAFATALPR